MRTRPGARGGARGLHADGAEPACPHLERTSAAQRWTKVAARHTHRVTACPMPGEAGTQREQGAKRQIFARNAQTPEQRRVTAFVCSKSALIPGSLAPSNRARRASLWRSPPTPLPSHRSGWICARQACRPWSPRRVSAVKRQTLAETASLKDQVATGDARRWRAEGSAHRARRSDQQLRGRMRMRPSGYDFTSACLGADRHRWTTLREVTCNGEHSPYHLRRGRARATPRSSPARSSRCRRLLRAETTARRDYALARAGEEVAHTAEPG
jgi:hypothetical protein